MTSSTAILQQSQQAASEEALRTFALRFHQKRPDVNLYSTVLPLRELLGRSRPDTYRHDSRQGYQRPLTASRLRQVAAYMQQEEGVLPTSLLVCIRQPDRATFEPVGFDSGCGEPGMLTIPAGELVMERLRALDHIAYIRFASVYRAFADVDELEQELEALKAGWRRPDVPQDQLALLPEAEAKAPKPRLLRVRRPKAEEQPPERRAKGATK